MDELSWREEIVLTIVAAWVWGLLLGFRLGDWL